MRLYALLATAMICVAAPAAFAGNPVGHYTIEGKNMDGDGTYSGVADGTRTGDTYRVVWVIGKKQYIGTGIVDKSFMAISYASGDSTGIALYAAKGDEWNGVWTYAGGTTLSTEHWTKQ